MSQPVPHYEPESERVKSGHDLVCGQRVRLDACPGFDINNVDREFFGEFVVEHVLPHEIGLYPRHPDRYSHHEDQMVFVRLPLPGAYHFWVESALPPAPVHREEGKGT